MAALAVLGALGTGCGPGAGETASPASVSAASGTPGASASASTAPGPVTGRLAPDPGTRPTAVGLPVMEQLECEEGSSTFRFGGGWDLSLSGTDELSPRSSDADETVTTCQGFPPIELTKSGRTVAAPDLIARTELFRTVPDPVAAVQKAVAASLPPGGQRRAVGEPTVVAAGTLALACRHNLADGFPMTSCFWADYGAVGTIDYFPPGGTRHFAMRQAVERTKEFAGTALRSTGVR
ncbi:hypothetical protein [Streptomyces sp. SP18CS02]|uniref:hypothetical protein n=1 Tax=Streptomyces sp. SP18CS02 TaxID=3002531 RepID=UPI002E769DFB|nr:hypothetical protein [Streptomyces sp. SP18CS02]MEE1753092.1 hypothetical protein [Streptomyces sp. SP18CS02]